MLGKVKINFIYVLFLIITPNLLVSEHFKTSAYKAKNDFLVNTMIDVAEKKLKGDSTKIVDTSMRERIRATQKKLNKVGLSVGPEDGIWGPKTETALLTSCSVRYSGVPAGHNDAVRMGSTAAGLSLLMTGSRVASASSSTSRASESGS